MSGKLKPCPFCGGVKTLTIHERPTIAYVECDPCDIAGPHAAAREGAITAWNTRADHSTALREALKEAVDDLVSLYRSRGSEYEGTEDDLVGRYRAAIRLAEGGE